MRSYPSTGKRSCIRPEKGRGTAAQRGRKKAMQPEHRNKREQGIDDLGATGKNLDLDPNCSETLSQS